MMKGWYRLLPAGLLLALLATTVSGGVNDDNKGQLGKKAALSGPRDAVDSDSGTPGATVEALLKQTKMDYKKLGPTAFRVLVEAKGEITPVIVEEKKAPWKDTKEKDVLYVFVWCEILPLPEDFKPSTAMLTRVAEFNDICRFGSIGMGKNSQGGKSLFRNITFYVRGADPEELADFLYVAHFDRLNIKKELRGFMEEK